MHFRPVICYFGFLIPASGLLQSLQQLYSACGF